MGRRIVERKVDKREREKGRGRMTATGRKRQGEEL